MTTSLDIERGCELLCIFPVAGKYTNGQSYKTIGHRSCGHVRSTRLGGDECMRCVCREQWSAETGVQSMRYIDAFNHFFPKRIYELLLASPAGQKDLGKRMRGIPALYDVDERLRVVESFPDYSQVICLGMPSLDRLAGPARHARVGAHRQRRSRRAGGEASRSFRRLCGLAADERARGGRARS